MKTRHPVQPRPDRRSAARRASDLRAPVPAGQLELFELRDRSVLVFGLGESGLAMARWAAHKGARVRVADTRAEPPQLAALRAHLPAVEFISAQPEPAWLEGVDLVAWSPGISAELGATGEFHALARARGVPVAGELELFAQALAVLRERGYEPATIAITGTNGKTTVTALAAHLCREAGLVTRSAGNIAPALLDSLREALVEDALPEVWVLELSSFQLALSESLVPDVATILNVAQDHLDWHASFESYLAAKQRIHAPGTIAVVNRADPASVPLRSTRQVSFGLDAPVAGNDFGTVREGALVWLAQTLAEEPAMPGRFAAPGEIMVHRLMPADALRIRGAHNHANALAALGLCGAIGVPMARMLHALRTYAGEPHRCQLVAVLDGVEYYNDSKGTNVSATVAGIEGLGRRCWLIAGGDGKGQDFSPLVEPVRRNAAGVVLIGRDAPLLRDVLEPTGVPLIECDSIAAALEYASAAAHSGEAVLLSPACASFDMFRNYGHRGEVFMAAVRALAERRGIAMELPC